MIKAPDVTLVYVIVAFVVSYAIMKRYLFVPLSRILDAREAEANEAAALHAQSLAELEQAVSRAERELAHARGEALKIREALRGEGRSDFDRRLADARDEAGRAIERATAEIGEEAGRSAGELPERSRALARQLAEKILGRKLAA